MNGVLAALAQLCHLDHHACKEYLINEPQTTINLLIFIAVLFFTKYYKLLWQMAVRHLLLKLFTVKKCAIFIGPPCIIVIIAIFVLHTAAA